MTRATLSVRTPGRGLLDLTRQIQATAPDGLGDGSCHVFLLHTSASLLITENADPRVLHDLNAWFDRAVPDGDPRYTHDDEGPDDMPSHIRAALTQPSLWIPVSAGRLLLGTWQGVFLFEHRTAPHTRRVVVTWMS